MPEVQERRVGPRAAVLRVPSACSIPDCDSPRGTRGWCVKHYNRWRAHGDPLVTLNPGLGQTEAERFWAKVDRRGPDDCWLWTGAVQSRGYGQLGVDGKLVYAHRWAYEHEVGPIPDGLTIDHLCRTRLCVNARHLEPVTNKVNIQRGESPWATNARKTHCVNGHEFTLENTFARPGGRGCRMCKRAHDRKRGPRDRRKVAAL